MITTLTITYAHNEHGAPECCWSIVGPLSADNQHGNCIPVPEVFKQALATAQHLSGVTCDDLGDLPECPPVEAAQGDPVGSVGVDLAKGPERTVVNIHNTFAMHPAEGVSVERVIEAFNARLNPAFGRPRTRGAVKA